MNAQAATPKKIVSTLFRKIEKLKRDTAGFTPGELPTFDKLDRVIKDLQEVETTAKRLRDRQLAEVIDAYPSHPVAFIREFLTANPTLDRKEVINRLLQLGLNPATVRTQYQRWRKMN